MEEKSTGGAEFGRGAGLMGPGAVMAASAIVTSEMVGEVDGEREREGSGRRRLMFLCSREARAAASFWARADSDMSLARASPRFYSMWITSHLSVIERTVIYEYSNLVNENFHRCALSR